MATLTKTATPIAMPGKPLSYYLQQVGRYLLLIFIGTILLAPFILGALGSFKTGAEIIAFPPKLLPASWQIENWTKVWTTDFGEGATFLRWLFNTAFLSVIIAVCQVIFCSMAAYAFARLRFPGQHSVFNFMLGTMMIPGAVTVIPFVRLP